MLPDAVDTMNGQLYSPPIVHFVKGKMYEKIFIDKLFQQQKPNIKLKTNPIKFFKMGKIYKWTNCWLESLIQHLQKCHFVS